MVARANIDSLCGLFREIWNNCQLALYIMSKADLPR